MNWHRMQSRCLEVEKTINLQQKAILRLQAFLVI